MKPGRCIAGVLLWMTLSGAGGAFAGDDDYSAIVAAAFAAIDEDYDATWAYTETSTEEGRTYVGRYDPRNPAGERWTLVSVDDRPPTAAETDAWRTDRDHGSDSGDDGGDDGRQDADIVTPGSLVLVEETADRWRFAFQPAADEEGEDGDAFMAGVDGTLVVRKDGPWLEELRLLNNAPIRPATGVKISRFDTRMRFGPAATDGPVVPLAIDVHVRGRAYLAVGFDEREVIRYSDFERVLPAVP